MVQIPVPGVKMKGLQWTTLPDRKVAGTVFSNFDIEKINLDFVELENQFAARVIEKKGKHPPSLYSNWTFLPSLTFWCTSHESVTGRPRVGRYLA